MRIGQRLFATEREPHQMTNFMLLLQTHGDVVQCLAAGEQLTTMEKKSPLEPPRAVAHQLVQPCNQCSRELEGQDSCWAKHFMIP